jgi:magnesium chelatase family protein
LRQPLEDRTVTISRAQGSLTFPANFMLVGAQNPCPCGYWGDPEYACSCSPMVISRYQKRLSGPLLDSTLAPHASAGVDIHVEVPRVPFQKLSDEHRGEPSSADVRRRPTFGTIRARVEVARARQSVRFANAGGVTPPLPLTANADMGPTQVRDHCPVDETDRHTEGAWRGDAAAAAGR